VLTNSANQQQLSLHHQQQPQSTSAGALRGAAAAGLSRQQLLAAGLSSGAAEQLYRCLYVYTMGFVDTIKVCQALPGSAGLQGREGSCCESLSACLWFQQQCATWHAWQAALT
jgi:hypothetical protein